MVNDEVVPQGPGSLLARGHDWEPTLVSLEMEYANAAPDGATRAVLDLVVHDFDDRLNALLRAQIELTEGDLQVLAGTIDALLNAIKEDEARA